MDDTILAILKNIVDFMEKNGSRRNNVSFGIDEGLVNEIYESTGRQYSLDELKAAADKCFAHEWIEHGSIGDPYGHLVISEKGLGVVRSKRKQELDKKNRTPLKKMSDYIEDHKGLFVFLGFLIPLIALVLKIYSGK